MKRSGVLIIAIVIIGGMMFFSCAGQRPENLGVQNKQLADCPSKPNCVSSQAADEDHFTAPLTYQGDKLSAFKHLKNVLGSFKNATIVSESDNYLHVEFKSTVMGFVDDMEFYFPGEKVIHLRSASRLGYSDFGVNSKRVKQLRELFVGE